jgi:hypothetical protein
LHVSVQPEPADAGGDDVVRRGLKRPSRGHQEAISDTHLAMPPATTWSEEAIKRQSRGHERHSPGDAGGDAAAGGGGCVGVCELKTRRL